MRRRTLLSALSGTAAGLAGCVGARLPTDDDDTNDPEDGEPDDPPIPPGSSIRTLATDCGGPDDEWVEVARGGNQLIIDGLTPAPNPCHEATVPELDLVDGTIDVTLGVASTLDDDVGCVQCLGVVRYELRVDVDPETVEAVTVRHEQGETHRIDPDADEEPSVSEATIETTDAGCGTGEDSGVEIDRDGSQIRLTGTRPAPNPCHRATLEEATVADRSLRLTVDVESDLDEGEGCIECVGQLEYDLTVELEGATSVDRVTVTHVDAGTHTVSWDHATEGN